MRPVISVIVPVYNAEKVLSRCVDSILEQSFRDFELILIDDCSKDSSYELCKKFAEQDKRIQIVHNSTNQGVSRTRNNGIEMSTGEYIAFIDSDDFVSEHYLSELLKTAKKFPSSLAMCSLISFNTAETIDDCVDIIEKYEIIDAKRYLCNQYCYHPWVWATLFESKIIKENKIYFAENARFSEDAHFVAKYMCFVESITISQNKLYRYFINPSGGAINKPDKNYTEKDVMARYSSLYALNDALEYIKKRTPSLCYYLEIGYCFLAADILLMAERANIKKFIHKKELRSKLTLKKVIQCHKMYTSNHHKLLVFCVKLSPKLTNFLLKLKK